MAEKKPTAAQLQALQNIANGLPIDHHCRTRSDHGGMSRTIVALHQRGWLRQGGDMTEAGKKVLKDYGQANPR